MTNKEFMRDTNHWWKVIKKIERIGDKRGYNTTDEKQQIAFAEAKIQEITEARRQEILNQNQL